MVNKIFKKIIKNQTILVTGGTGSFGSAVIDNLLQYNLRKVIVFDQDEKQLFDMGNKINDNRLKIFLGDVRDENSIYRALYKVDYVFHAAALKQVPNCEFFPLETIKTNSLGAHNVIDAAIENNVKRVVVLSTDKAVHPINAMGMTKALMEKIMVAASREKRGKTILCGTRYGNVMYTRGSVIPYFIDLMRAGKPLTVTNKNMTRFLMSLNQSIDLVFYALTNGKNGDIYVRKAPASTIGDLAQALVEIFNYKKGIKEIGIRPGEKMHEELVSREEVVRTKDCEDYFSIRPEVPDMDYRSYYFKGMRDDHVLPAEGYTSANTKRLNVKEAKKLLLALNEIKEDLKILKN